MNLSMQNKARIGLVLVGCMIFYAVYQGMNKPKGLRFTVSGDTAYVNGGTDTMSYFNAKSFINNNPQIRKLVLMRMPGTVDSGANLEIARLIRERGISTHLDKNSRIASGAVDLFISGKERTMECGAMIGVHSWSYNGEIGPKDLGVDRFQYRHESFLREMGVNPAFYVFTREAADPDEIYFLQPDEIEKFGLLTEPLNCET